MAKQSAGVLLYQKHNSPVQVLLVHPGGPFWARKDKGAWSIPKGEFDEAEEPLTAAKREFQEELGQTPPAGDYRELGTVKNKSGKVIHVWAVEGDLDVKQFKSNTFTLEWPPRSGRVMEFPEADKAAWFDLDTARQKLHPAQTPFLDRLAELLDLPPPAEQTTLL
jgi:predicted NUDIX family NTP pyrophosphohydrolase